VSNLPPGFVLDGPAPAAGLPQGFVLDGQPQGTSLDRGAALGAQGTRVGLLNTFGAPVDLVTAGLNKLGANIQNPIGGSQSLNQAADWVASLPGKVAPEYFSKGERLTPQTQTEKAIHGAGEAAGTAIGTIMPAGAVARAAAPATMTRAIAETLAAQPAMQVASSAAGGAVQGATDNPYLGLATALAVPTAAGIGARVVSPQGPARTAAETERRRLVDVLLQRDVPLTTGEITGNKGIQTLESVLETLPLSGGLQRGFSDRQRQAVNRTVTDFTGNSVPAFTNAERQAQRVALGNQFENLAQNTTVNLDNQFTNELSANLARYQQQLPPDVYRNVEQRLQALIGAATQPGNPQIPGDIYQRIRSSLSQQATNAGNGEVRDALRGARNSLDAAARRSLPPDVAQQWDDVRRQWGNLRTIENSMRNVDAAVGDISPRALGQAVDTANRRGGSRDMTDTAAALRAVLGNKMAQSGTQPRSFWQDIATGGVLGGGAYTATGSPGVALASVLAAPTIQVALENPVTRAWAANQLASNVPTLPGGALAAKLAAIQAMNAKDPSAQSVPMRRPIGARQ
jgi:hypothetical protein